MLKFIDCHTHLSAADFDNDLDDVISRAIKAGVAHALVVAENVDQFDGVLQLAKRYPDFCLPCLGVHPVQGDPLKEQRSITPEDVDKAMPMIEEFHDKILAIGEVGLDFSPRFCKLDSDKENQKNALCRWVELSKEYDLPLNVHSRSAGRPTIALLKEQGAERVLLHAFDGRPGVAEEGVRCGYYFSIPPSIVRSEQKERLVARIPLQNMVLETDCPALGPEKQVRNEPANVRISCKYIAKIKKLDEETVAKVVWENSLKLFPRISRFLAK